MNKCDYLVLLSHIQLIWANIQGVKNCFKIFLIYILPLLPTCWSRFYDSKRQKRSEGGQETKTILKLTFFEGGGHPVYHQYCSQYCKKSWWYYQIEVSWCGSEWLAQYSISETGGSPANYATLTLSEVMIFVFCIFCLCLCLGSHLSLCLYLCFH